MKFYLKIVLLYIAKFLGLFYISEILTRKSIRILCYHGGAYSDEHLYNPKLFCHASLYKKRIEWLISHKYTFITLDEALDNLRDKNVKRHRPVVITFDDGWHTTFNQLIPILSQYKIPSTLYLCTKHFTDGGPVPNVCARYIVWKAGSRQVDIIGLSHDIDGAYDLARTGEREVLAKKLSEYMTTYGLDRESVCRATQDCAYALGISQAELNLESKRFDYAEAADIQAAVQNGCSIQLHGHIHMYAAGNNEAILKDIERCRQIVQDSGFGNPVHYCYPSGTFDAQASSLLSSIGVASATTCIPGLIRTGHPVSIYYLPRFLDGHDVKQIEFEAECSGFRDLLRNVANKISRKDVISSYSH